MGEEKVFLTTDELIRQMELDEIEDAPLVTPVNYAKVRPITPQLVYYAIRTKKIPTYVCNCGRRCINREEADNYFRSRRGPVAWPYGLEPRPMAGPGSADAGLPEDAPGTGE